MTLNPEVHWGYRVLTHIHMGQPQVLQLPGFGVCFETQFCCSNLVQATGAQTPMDAVQSAADEMKVKRETTGRMSGTNYNTFM